MDYLPIIRTPAGGWVAPRDVLVVPTALQYRGSPLFKSGNCADRNSPYTAILLESDHDVRFLEALGARIFNKDDVRAILAAPEFSFQTKGYGWIAALFEYLHANPSADPTSSPYLHLETGEWTAPHVGLMYIGKPADIPFDLASVNISILNGDFVTEISKIETARLYLTEELQIGKLSEATIISAIFDRHARGPSSTDLYPQKLDAQICMAHAQFLSRHHRLIDWDQRAEAAYPFYVVSQDGRLRKAEEMVTNKMVSRKKRMFPISDLGPPSFPFLSSSYPPEVAQFLAKRLGVKATFPLTEPTAPPTGPTEAVPESTTLHSMFSADEGRKTNFGLHYLSAIWADLPLEIRQNNTILQQLQTMPCHCKNGRFVPLRQAFLRTSKLAPCLSPEMDVLDLPSSGHPRWLFLEALGVTTEPNVEFLIWGLRHHIGKQIPRQMSEGYLEALYGDLFAYYRKCYSASEQELLRLVYPSSPI
jgi:hypothetical protein